ncbi:hypothetical protein [Fodinicola acaciae]|uniref:hypothetical protein n=1 Tax=Fodinicola acaciae TaxID=2681555 RepID=UPI0013D50F65|nr:hypothetical protein [Fodinicola acaciae]
MDSQRPDDESGPTAGDNRPDPHAPDGELPELPPEWSDLVVPDDASALAAEAEQVRAELRAERRRRRWEKVLRGRRWERYGMSGPLVILVLVVVSSIAALLIAVLPTTAPRVPQAAPLARPATSPGLPGGLLPDVQLHRVDGSAVALRGIRPAVVLLVADACDCQSVIEAYIDATAAPRLELLVVGEHRRPAVPELAMSRIVGLTDPAAALTRALPVHSHPGQPTSVLVRDTGVIARIVIDATDASALHDDITALA